MKMNKKKVLSLSLVIVLIAILSFGTLAWFNDADKVTNTFYVASDDTDNDGVVDPDEIFSVDIWEDDPDDIDDDGQVKDQDGLEYENIVPGGTYEKKPYVENTGSYDQWIRVTVKVTNADAWIAALGNGYPLESIFKGFDGTKWTRVEMDGYNGSDNTYSMVFYLNAKLAKDEMVPLFTAVEIPSQLTQEDMVFIDGKFEITISVDALQADGTGATAKEAFEALWPLGAPAPTN